MTSLAHAAPTVPTAPASGAGVRHDLRHELATLQVLMACAQDDSAQQISAQQDSAQQDSAQHDPVAELTSLRELVATASIEIRYALDLLDGLPADAAPAPAGRPVSGVSDLAALLRFAASAARGRTRSVTVDSESDLLVPLPSVSLTRVVRNLLGNALETPGGSTVLLRGMRVADPAGSGGPGSPQIRLEVHDDGRGPARAGFRRGGGLGLEVVRSIVLPVGGWLVLGPSPLGGACAAVTLPGAAR